MTGFTPVMDFFCFTFYISVTLPLSLLQKFTRLHAKLLLDGCKDKKTESFPKNMPGHLFEDAPGIFFFHPIAISKKYPYLCSSF